MNLDELQSKNGSIIITESTMTTAHDYNYHSNFWDEQDQGVRVLLEHVKQGLDSLKKIVDFFEERCKLEKEYSRRLSAIASQLSKDMASNPDYGKLHDSLQLFHSIQQKLSQSHGKEAEQIHRQNLSELKEFLRNAIARFKTIEGKIRHLRQDKLQKKQLCVELKEKLDKASIELRDCHLNHQNTLGTRQTATNEKQLFKWRSIVDELTLKLDVMKQENASSQRHWIQEWYQLSMELQNLEESRIQTIKLKLQEFSKFSSDIAIEEQIYMEKLITRLNQFTIQQDIYNFSYNHGTGRIKTKFSDEMANKNSSTPSGKYVESVKNLSTKLQMKKDGSIGSPPLPISKDNEISITRGNQSRQMNEIIVPSKAQILVGSPSSECSNNSSIPTDFTLNIKTRASIDSMATSISSLASSINDAQRVAKSWNSQNRRKSRSLVTPIEGQDSGRSTSMDTTRRYDTSDPLHIGSTSYQQRRKSLALDVETALEVIEKEESEKKNNLREEQHANNKSSPGTIDQGFIPFTTRKTKRVVHNGKDVILPLKNSKDERVIGYAKALYSYNEPNDNGILNFQLDDYLLLSERLNKDWCIGEIYNTTGPQGLIPMNYVEELSS